MRRDPARKEMSEAAQHCPGTDVEYLGQKSHVALGHRSPGHAPAPKGQGQACTPSREVCRPQNWLKYPPHSPRTSHTKIQTPNIRAKICRSSALNSSSKSRPPSPQTQPPMPTPAQISTPRVLIPNPKQLFIPNIQSLVSGVPNFKPSALLSTPKTLAPKIQTRPRSLRRRTLTARSTALPALPPSPCPWTLAPGAHTPALGPPSQESDAAPTRPTARGDPRLLAPPAWASPAPKISRERLPRQAPARASPPPPSRPCARRSASLTFRGLRPHGSGEKCSKVRIPQPLTTAAFGEGQRGRGTRLRGGCGAPKGGDGAGER